MRRERRHGTSCSSPFFVLLALASAAGLTADSPRLGRLEANASAASDERARLTDLDQRGRPERWVATFRSWCGPAIGGVTGVGQARAMTDGSHLVRRRHRPRDHHRGRRSARRHGALAKQVSATTPTVQDGLLLVCVLKGAVMFMADFARALGRHGPPVELEFMAVSSYGQGTTSSGVVRILKDLDRDIAGRHVIVVEDIVDSGLTLSWLLKYLESRAAASVEVVALFRKPDAIKVPRAGEVRRLRHPDRVRGRATASTSVSATGSCPTSACSSPRSTPESEDLASNFVQRTYSIPRLPYGLARGSVVCVSALGVYRRMTVAHPAARVAVGPAGLSCTQAGRGGPTPRSTIPARS